MYLKTGSMLFMKIPGKHLINMAVELTEQGLSESGWSRIKSEDMPPLTRRDQIQPSLDL